MASTPAPARCTIAFVLGGASGIGLTLVFWASTLQDIAAATIGAALCLVGVTAWGVRSGP